MTRAKTAEEAREAFLDQIRTYVSYWASNNVGDKTVRERLDGLAFSILNILDGTSSGLPAMDIVLRPHSDDKAYCQEEGETWYEDGQTINADIMLHDLWYKPMRKPE